VRYYRNGALASTSNFVMKGGFVERLMGA